MCGQLPVRLAAGDGPGMWGAHHDAFENGLAADQGFLAAFESRQELDGYQKTPQCSEKLHIDWMFSGAS
jgi:hypothetical protein